MNLYAYAESHPVNGYDPLGLWTISGSVYSPLLGPVGPGIGVSIHGRGGLSGLEFDAVGLKLGVGAGLTLSPWGTPPDSDHMQLGCCGANTGYLKNGIGFYSELSVAAGVGVGTGYNYGGTQIQKGNNVDWQSYSGFSSGPSIVSPRIGTAAQIGIGVEFTKYFK